MFFQCELLKRDCSQIIGGALFKPFMFVHRSDPCCASCFAAFGFAMSDQWNGFVLNVLVR